MNEMTNLDKVDFEREENLPPSALLGLGLGLLIAVGLVLFAGIGAIVEESRGGSGWTGGLVGGGVGVALATVFVLVESARLTRQGR